MGSMIDTLKGAALIATFFGFLAMCAALVQWPSKDRLGNIKAAIERECA